MDPLLQKAEKNRQLDAERSSKIKELIDLTNKVNQARDKAEAIIKSHSEAVKQSTQEYIDFINSLEIIKVQTKKRIQDE